MLRQIGNDKNVPNNYVYTSHKGSEYIFLEGVWYNCINMMPIDSSKNFKMNQAALRQISEQNESSTLRIGKKYLINESEYVYVGRGKVTKDGSLLHESINNTIVTLMEAENSKFSDFTKADPSKVEIPNKFKLDDYVFIKNKNKWFGNGKLVDDSQFNSELNADAVKLINKYNKTDEYPVNSTIKYDGKPYVWSGTSWVAEDGRIAGDKFSQLVDNYFDENPDVLNGSQTSSSASSDEKTSGNGELEKGATHTDKYGRKYVYDGSQFVSNDAAQAPHPESDELVKKYIQDRKDMSAGKSNIDNPVNADAGTGSNDNSTDTSTDNTSSTVPNGYVYTSGKGKNYVKRGDQWYNTETKKPVNSSSAAPLERAAQDKIAQHNEKAAVKIGDEWKSKSGVTYKYVGGNRFVGDNGKLLPQDTARNVLQSLWQKSDEERAQNEEEPEQSQDSGTSDTGSSDTSSQPQGTPPSPKPQEQGTGSGDPLQSLADKIKSHPKGGKIAVLLSRGDPLSLMAADILLNGQQSEAAQILNSLNNED